MNTNPIRIGIFFSPGEHFLRAVRNVRAQYPAAHITAIIPSEFPAPSEELASLVNTCERTELTRYRPYHFGPLRRLVQQIRNGHYDHFIILYETLKLRGFAALSGAPVCECWTAYGRIKPIHASMWDTLTSHFRRTTRGRFRYWRIWFLTHLTKSGPPPKA